MQKPRVEARRIYGLSTYGGMTGTKQRYNRLLRVVARAKELGWPMSVSMTITTANRAEASDMFAAAALSGASLIQIGAMMAEGRGKYIVRQGGMSIFVSFP